MTVLLALLGKIWPFLLAAALGGAIAGWTTHGFDSIALNRQKTAMASYQAQVSQREADAEKAAREALQAQMDAHHVIDQRNESVIADLTQRAQAAESDAALTGRLLAAQKARLPPSHPVSETGHQPTVVDSGETSGLGQLAAVTAAALNECRGNARQLNALIDEIKPQMEQP